MKRAFEYLESKGVRPSQQRIEIIDFLLNCKSHPTAEDIYVGVNEKWPMLSKSTVYNTLKVFEEQGVVMTVGIDERNVRYEVMTECHAHFRCMSCGKIFDMPILEKPKVLGLEGVEVSEMQVYYKGTCSACEAKRKKEEEKRNNV